ncbi:MAG TPA: adenylate/guanylate cyclase domain-containing protein, partial [Dehalococcoidia bacterium]
REALAWGMESGARDPRVLACACILEYVLGNIDAGRSALQRLIDFVGATPPGPTIDYADLAIAAARAALIDGRGSDREIARRAGRALLDSPVPCTPLVKTYAYNALGMLAHVEGDRALAEQVLQGIASQASYAQEMVFATDHMRGLLLEVLDKTDEAVGAIEAALTFLRSDYRPHRAEAAYDCARIRLQRDAPGDRERARALIDEALGHAQKLGMRPLIDKLVALKLQDQGISTITDIYTSIDVVADSVGRERPEIATHAAPDGTVTIMFSDIEDSTVLTERLGDRAWQDLLREHNTLIREQLRAHDGYEVKTMGDGFMMAFQSAKKGLDCAIAIQKAFADHNAVAGEHVKVRIGLHAGEVIKDQDDFYGKNVILASRVAGKAAGGEILVSSLLQQLVESTVGAQMFGEPREVELKGLSGAHTVYAVAVQ